MANFIVGGVEGGSTKTFLTLMNGDGKILSMVKGPSSNPLVVGYENSAALVAEMIKQAKTEANLMENLRLHSLGLCLSGIEQDSIVLKLKNTFLENFPNLSDNYYINSDTRAPLALVSDRGGIVLISGTGSNCLLINASGSEVNCGGFGDKLGDEGSAYWISHKGIKICIDCISNFEKPPLDYPITQLWEKIKEFFNIKNIYDLIPIFYSDYKKDGIAALCLQIAGLALNGDKLSKWLFEKAGKDLAKHVQAVYSNIDKSQETCEGTLKIVCVGSVWNSWELLKPGFEAQLRDATISGVPKLCLLKTTVCGSIGACYLASKQVNLSNFPYTYSQNYEVFYDFSK